MSRAEFTRWLGPLPLKGWPALACIVAALAVPTAIRAAVNGEIGGCEFTPYLPSVFACAMLLSWRQASLAALTAAAIMGGVLEGSSKFQLPCFASAVSMFFLASAVMIGAAILLRRAIAPANEGAANGGGVVFSLEKGEVWASWYGQSAPVLLGSQRKVAEMMEDFLAQEKLGKRLTRK